MNKCPAQGCGRGFESIVVMEEHLRRRHPKYKAEAANTTYTANDALQEETNKLPKIRTLKGASRDKKGPQIYLRSNSKGKSDQVNILNTSTVTAVISESREYIEASENSLKYTKKVSISKRNVANQLDIKKQKLPQIKTGRPLKLNALTLNKDSSQQQKDLMYATAPSFKKIQKADSLREKSKSKQKYSLPNSQISQQNESNTHANEADKLILAKTQIAFHEKDSRLQRPIKRVLDKPIDKQKLTQSFVEQNKDSQQITQVSPKKDKGESNKPTLRRNTELKTKPLRRQGSLKKAQIKVSQEYNFQQRIIVFKDNVGPRLVIPSSAKVQFIFANKCNLNWVNLNNIEWLREISLQHNQIKDLTFLNYPNNYTIQKIYLDHNQITALDSLPINLKVLSLTFNFIQGLEGVAKDLSRLSKLQEVDFTFNPIRKESNYKLHMLSSCRNLHKIDGIKITKFDLQLAAQYARMLDEQLGLIPSQKYGNLLVSKCSASPSTVISATDQQQQEAGLSQFQLQKQISKLTKVIKQTKEHLQIIKEQNRIIAAQTQQLRAKQQEEKCSDSGALYDKLKIQCQALQLLNFLQYCSEEELEQLIQKKQNQV